MEGREKAVQKAGEGRWKGQGKAVEGQGNAVKRAEERRCKARERR